MKTPIALAIAFCLFLTACGLRSIPPSNTPSDTSEPALTLTTASTSTPTPLPPTDAPAPPNKAILFEYYSEGGFTAFNAFLDPGSSPIFPRLVLYADGQLILPGEPYLQKTLSPKEVQAFQSKLDALGLNAIEIDKLYIEGYSGPSMTDGQEICIVSNMTPPKKLCAFGPDLQFVVPQLKAVLEYLDAYQPEGLTPYTPDRILVSSKEGRYPADENLPQTAVPWSEKFPALTSSLSVFFVEGEMAKEIFTLFANPQMGQVFTQNGKEFTVCIQVMLPHEMLTNSN